MTDITKDDVSGSDPGEKSIPPNSAAAASESAASPLESIIRFAACERVSYLIERGRFNKLPMRMQAYSTNANADFLQLAGIAVHGKSGEVFAFSSEAEAVAGMAAVQKIPKFAKKNLVPISISPTLFLVTLQKTKPGVATIDLGSPKEFELWGPLLDRLEELAMLVRIATLPAFYILEARDGNAITIDDEGGKFAVGFLNRDQGRPTLEGMALENPGCKLGKNKPGDLVHGLLSSDLAGIIVNPASNTQTTLSRDQLEVIRLATTIVPEAPSSVLDSVKRLFGR